MNPLGRLIGQVDEEERIYILALFERRLGIEELTLTLESELLSDKQKEELSQKIKKELPATECKLQEWWKAMYDKYQWERIEGHQWHINFDTGEIFLD